MTRFTDEEWRRVSPLIDVLMELEPKEQSEALRRELPDEPALIERIERLLRADRAAAGFLDSPSTEMLQDVLSELGTADRASTDLSIGVRVGPYRLIEEIGHGGMGSVYLGERDDAEFQQRVAIKFVRGGVAGREARSRFLRERQILADLAHRNIARLLDGGTTGDGVPYLVMEFIEGRPIDRYCDDLGLGIGERLALFEDVCEAVQYAHGQLVVHRDLKPGNILVTPEGRVKLLDFGVAKLLGADLIDDTADTRTGMRLLTPEFASPEQLGGRAVTVASDVYSLGVLLYLLLSGQLPHPAERMSPIDLERRITEEPPERPSAAYAREHAEIAARRRASTVGGLSRRLRGDLDNISLKALRPEPERRYPSVSALLEDLRRHAAGLPVTARPVTLRYRLRLFARRNRVALLAASLVVAALSAGLAGTMWQARTASIEARKASQVTEFVIDLFEVVDPATSRGDSITARQMLERGAERVQRELADQPLVQAQMMHVLGTIYWKLSLFEPAEQMHREALALRTAERGPASLEVAESLTSLGAVATLQGRYDEADSLLDGALGILRRAVGSEDPRVADALAHRAVSARHQGNLPQAEALHREALEIRRAVYGASDSHTLGSLKDLGLVLHSMNRLEEAEATYREALGPMIELHGENHPDVGTTLHSLAALVTTLGRFEEAQLLAERALEVQRTVHGPRHRLVANALDQVAAVVDARGDIARAVELHSEILTLKRELLGDAHPSVATSLNNQGIALRDMGRLDEADENLGAALAIYRDRFGERHPSVAVVLRNRGSVEVRRGAWQAAADLYAAALAIDRESLPEPHLDTATALTGLGEATLSLGDPQRAEEFLREALRIREQLLVSPHWRLAEVRTLLSQAVAEQGRYPEAESLAVAALRSVAETGSRLDAEQSTRAQAAVETIRRRRVPVQ